MSVSPSVSSHVALSNLAIGIADVARHMANVAYYARQVASPSPFARPACRPWVPDQFED